MYSSSFYIDGDKNCLYEINIMYIYSKILIDLDCNFHITKRTIKNMSEKVEAYKEHSKILEFYLLINKNQES
jgi:hypothetical protein